MFGYIPREPEAPGGFFIEKGRSCSSSSHSISARITSEIAGVKSFSASCVFER